MRLKIGCFHKMISLVLSFHSRSATFEEDENIESQKTKDLLICNLIKHLHFHSLFSLLSQPKDVIFMKRSLHQSLHQIFNESDGLELIL